VTAVADTEELATLSVLGRRFGEALEAGLTMREAWAWAQSGQDVSELRRLVALGCPPRLIARIVRP
jgi:hypothetical protein